MEPLKIKVSKDEAWAIHSYIKETIIKAGDKNARIEIIILAEYYMVWTKKLMAYHRTNSTVNVPKPQKIPVSVGRILHYRLQHEPYDQVNQGILSKLDQALTNRNMKPDFSTNLF
jgi:hypothetical protein